MNKKWFLLTIVFVIAFLWLASPSQTFAAPSGDPPMPSKEDVCTTVNHFRNKLPQEKSIKNGYRVPDPFDSKSFDAYLQMIAQAVKDTGLSEDVIRSVIYHTVNRNTGFAINLANTVKDDGGKKYVIFYDDPSKCPPPSGAPAASSSSDELSTKPHEFDTKLMFAPALAWAGAGIVSMILVFIYSYFKIQSRKGVQITA